MSEADDANEVKCAEATASGEQCIDAGPPARCTHRRKPKSLYCAHHRSGSGGSGSSPQGFNRLLQVIKDPP